MFPPAHSKWLAIGALLAAAHGAPLHAAHALAWGAQPKYPANYAHFDYVNPAAPRGGTLNLDGFGSFDKLNPFTLKGLPAAGIERLMFDTLAESSDDEPLSMYGLLAQDMDFAADGLSITFRLDPRARFSDGSPVVATDVKHSFDTLTARQAHPRYRQYFADVARVVVVDERTVRFEFKRRNHELHMIIGAQLPVFSRRWGEGRPFDQVVQDAPIASGPYLIEKADWGRTITYRRNPSYWARELPARRGMFNFDRITYKYFKDETARLEGFKAGEFDWIFENSAKNWARGHAGRKYDSGELVKREFRHSNAAGMQGFVLNTRRPLFRDVRVRRALALAMDFEWMNRQVFYGQYVRSPSYFTNSDMQAKGPPGPEERALIDALPPPRDPALEGDAPMPASTDPPGSLRANLRAALALLAQAGWNVADDGRLRDASGRAFEFEILTYSRALERVAVPWARNLEKLGIHARLRISDPALYQKRADEFDFDVMVHSYSASQTPGNELVERFTSAAADEKGSDNLAGIRDPRVDAVVQRVLASATRAELVTGARVLDRLLRQGWYLVPHYYAPTHRVAYRRGLAYPATLPLYYRPDGWMLKTWWFAPGATGTPAATAAPRSAAPASAAPSAGKPG
ncbi:MAG: extracellular solute-binding protein [Burkholderiaceae bacterium]